jgi:hypothetical protein
LKSKKAHLPTRISGPGYRNASCLRKGAASLLFALLCVSPASADTTELQSFHPDGAHHLRNAPPVQEKDLWFQDLSRKPYSECWYYLAVAQDGTIFFCHFNLVRINFLVKQYALDFNLFLPDGTRHFFADSFEGKEVEWGTDRFFVKLGPNRIQGTLERQVMHIEELGYTLDLTFFRKVDPLRDGTGRIFLDPEKRDYLDITYQPDLKVEGTLKQKNLQVPLTGWGYGDHVRQTFIPTDFAKVLYAFRVKVGEIFLTALEYHPEPTYRPARVPCLIVTYRDRLLAVSHDYTLKTTGTYTDPKRSTDVPEDFQLKDRAENFELECTAEGDLLQRVDLLASVKSFQKSVLELFGIRSFSYVFEEKTRCTVRSPDVSGTFQGTGVLEVLVSE